MRDATPRVSLKQFSLQCLVLVSQPLWFHRQRKFSDTFLEDFPVSIELFSSTTSLGFQELDQRILGRLLICPEDQKMSNRIPSASISIDNK